MKYITVGESSQLTQPKEQVLHPFLIFNFRRISTKWIKLKQN